MSTRGRPLIGIPCRTFHDSRDNVERFGVGSAYTEAVERAGGAPLLIPLRLSEESLAAILTRIDGLLLAGGGDVHPQEFGEEAEPLCTEIDPARDEAELRLTRWALGEEKPVFGVCRGIQLLNVAAGGNLYQDIGSQVKTEIDHRHVPGEPFEKRTHAIEIEPGTLLARAIGAESVEVNSLHHQALKQVASNLRVSARAPDGLVEAVEGTSNGFVLGVQFHPEWLCVDDPAMQRLFDVFVASAEENRKDRIEREGVGLMGKV